MFTLLTGAVNLVEILPHIRLQNLSQGLETCSQHVSPASRFCLLAKHRSGLQFPPKAYPLSPRNCANAKTALSGRFSFACCPRRYCTRHHKQTKGFLTLTPTSLRMGAGMGCFLMLRNLFRTFSTDNKRVGTVLNETNETFERDGTQYSSYFTIRRAI